MQMPAVSNFLAKLRPEKYDIREITDKYNNGSGAATAATSSKDRTVSDAGASLSKKSFDERADDHFSHRPKPDSFKPSPERFESPKTKDDVVHELLAELHTLYHTDDYLDNDPDDLSPRRPSWPAITVHESRARDSNTPAPLRSASFSKVPDEYVEPPVRQISNETPLKLVGGKYVQLQQIRPIPPNDPETPPPLRFTPKKAVVPRKAVPPSSSQKTVILSESAVSVSSPSSEPTPSSQLPLATPEKLSKSRSDHHFWGSSIAASTKEVLKDLDAKFKMPKRTSTESGQGDHAVSRKLQRSSNKKDLLADEEHIFSPKSKLIGRDLSQEFFLKPESWDMLSEKEKALIRHLMPANATYDADGRPSADFLKYNNDWRGAVRQFQEDLERGYQDAEWLRQAHVASEERRAGKFDDFKEQQFEEFWGQKKKFNPATALIKKSELITLEEMVYGHVFRVGDCWSYSRCFKKGGTTVIVEKDAKVVKITDDGKLAFAIPPGQLKYFVPRKPVPARPSPKSISMEEARNNFQRLRTAQSCDNFGSKMANQSKLQAGENSRSRSRGRDRSSMDVQRSSPPPSAGILKTSKATYQSPQTPSRVRKVTFSDSEESSPLSPLGSKSPTPPSGSDQAGQMQRSDVSKATPSRRPVASPVEEEPKSPTPTYFRGLLFGSPSAQGSPRMTTRSRPGTENARENTTDSLSPVPENVASTSVVCTVARPQDLERSILQVDGRIMTPKSDSEVSGYAWKAIRCRRNDKDIGSLFEVRERFYKEGLQLK